MALRLVVNNDTRTNTTHADGINNQPNLLQVKVLAEALDQRLQISDGAALVPALGSGNEGSNFEALCNWVVVQLMILADQGAPVTLNDLEGKLERTLTCYVLDGPF